VAGSSRSRDFFEKIELALVTAYPKPGMTVIDVGVYSVRAAKMVRPTGMVWVFEPSLEKLPPAAENFQSNGCDRVRLG
jgi:hypothetical protein